MTPPAHRGRSGHDRWLVSYADFTTLLFAFFVTMYAMSSVGAGSGDSSWSPLPSPLQLSAQSGDSSPWPSLSSRPLLVAPARAVPAAAPLEDVRIALMAVLADAVTAGRVEVIQDPRGLVLSLPEAATFRTGSAEVTPRAEDLIAQVARSLTPLTNALRIEGHTDDMPIRTSRYRSNWELSTARASSVVAFLIGRARMPPARLSAAGYAEFHPLVPNDSAEHRARNRRVDIIVVPRTPQS